MIIVLWSSKSTIIRYVFVLKLLVVFHHQHSNAAKLLEIKFCLFSAGCPLLDLLWIDCFMLLSTQQPLPFFLDEHRLSDYSIGPESKLNLVIKPLEKASPEDPTSRAGLPQSPTIWHMLAQILSRHYTVADTEKVLEQVQKVNFPFYMNGSIGGRSLTLIALCDSICRHANITAM